MRLFLAIELPEALLAELAALQRRLATEWPGWRWTPAAGIHLTLRFLGEVDPGRVERQCGEWAAASRPFPAFSFGVEGLGCFPPRGAPRVLWVGVQEPGPGGVLTPLVQALESTARQLGFPEERRPFRPHLTLARARRGQCVGRPSPDLAPYLGEVTANRVTLVRSELSSAGARYTALREFPLSGKPPAGEDR